MFGTKPKVRHVPIHAEEDPTGASSAVRDFNEHIGPARVFYNRHAQTFYTQCFPMGGDRYWGDMVDCMDYVELYRKTSEMPEIRVTVNELHLMEQEVGPYSAW